MGKMLFDNLEYVVVIGGAAVAFCIFKSKSFKGNRNDLTPLMLKLDRQRQAVNKKGKGMFS